MVFTGDLVQRAAPLKGCRDELYLLGVEREGRALGILGVHHPVAAGSSIGPFRIVPPLALIRSVAALMSGTRK